MSGIFDLALPLMRLLPPEAAHRATIRVLAAGFAPKAAAPDSAALEVRLWGRRIPNPVGLAAGFDKDAEVPDAMLAFGFGFVECGTITPLPQKGNPKPRLFRLPEDHAVINRLGFNSGGVAAAAKRLALRRDRPGFVGANIGKNRDTLDDIGDYVEGVRVLAPLVDYLTVNISSPNTPGLRDLQRKSAVTRLIGRLIEARAKAGLRNPPPLLLKIAPDLSAEERVDLAEAAQRGGGEQAGEGAVALGQQRHRRLGVEGLVEQLPVSQHGGQQGEGGDAGVGGRCGAGHVQGAVGIGPALSAAAVPSCKRPEARPAPLTLCEGRGVG